MTHLITARTSVIPSRVLLSSMYCPAPDTVSRLALIKSDNSADTPSRSLTSLFDLMTLYLNVYVLTSTVLVGMKAGKISLPTRDFSASNVRPIQREGEIYAGVFISVRRTEKQSLISEALPYYDLVYCIMYCFNPRTLDETQHWYKIGQRVSDNFWVLFQ